MQLDIQKTARVNDTIKRSNQCIDRIMLFLDDLIGTDKNIGTVYI